MRFNVLARRLWFGINSFALNRGIRCIFRCSVQKVDKVVIVVDWSLGLGDLLMLSRVVHSFKLQNRHISVRWYSCNGFRFDLTSLGIEFEHQDSLDELGADQVILVPTWLSKNVSFLFSRAPVFGFILGRKSLSNFKIESVTYDERQDHFCERLCRLLASLSKASFVKFDGTVHEGRLIPNSHLLRTERTVVLNWDDSWPSRSLPKALKTRLVQRFIDSGYSVYLIGLGTDLIHDVVNGRVVDFRGERSLSELVEIMDRSSLYVGIDSGLTHLAEATGIPVLAVFGCVNHTQRLCNRNSVGISNAGNCRLHPCYVGLTEPKCGNLVRFQCMDVKLNQIDQTLGD